VILERFFVLALVLLRKIALVLVVVLVLGRFFPFAVEGDGFMKDSSSSSLRDRHRFVIASNFRLLMMRKSH